MHCMYAEDERWCEEEKAIPFKKRRGTFDMNDANKKTKGKMKTKMNNKCSNSNTSEEEEEEEEEKEEKVKVKVKGKKRGRGSAVMEGSRCSRVNGRGWRCCQQTLVGYSLCEHHLGKGRLRSMTSVRNRSSTTTAAAAPTTTTTNNNKPIIKEEEEDKRRKMIMGGGGGGGGGGSSKKKMKQLGMVKARSINSLLGQTSNNTPITTNK
ncbi:hypothetical protein PIB30_116876 [Stylosanthes scabra]|uniref:WRC domain-containing protein n=1 Tax=Stylosanthes scabra TaxID=79078 RepID=A0ABU6S239_9FABA|nr:hypothetical protein [Stylosanthes scabra]